MPLYGMPKNRTHDHWYSNQAYTYWSAVSYTHLDVYKRQLLVYFQAYMALSLIEQVAKTQILLKLYY